MNKLVLFFCGAALVAFSGCNQGEIKLLKDQVAELKAENVQLRMQLEEAKIQLARNEAINQDLSGKMEKVKEMFPDVSGLGDALEAAKDIGLDEFKDFDKEKFLEKAKDEFKKKTTF